LTSAPHGKIDVAGIPACLECGTCCFSTLPEYLRVFGVDLDRMDDRAQALTHFIGNRCYLQLDEGHCKALVIDPAARRYVCSIYEMRPDVCRALERGSGQCRGELATKAERPLLAVEALLRRPSSGEPGA
jgi:Fe-S-cluster containining protein